MKYFFAFLLLWCTQVVVAQNAEAKHNTIYLSTSDFIDKVDDYKTSREWKYKGTVPCLIDFYATWCGPCRALSPILEEVAGEYNGKVIIYKVDVDKEKELAALFNVRSIPTLLFVPVAEQPSVIQGGLPKDAVKELIDVILLGQKPKNMKMWQAEESAN